MEGGFDLLLVTDEVPMGCPVDGAPARMFLVSPEYELPLGTV